MAIHNKEIDSRNRVTDAAILNVLGRLQVKTALDIGCGEGWLVRALSERGVNVEGVDGVPGLIDKARTLGHERYRVVSYDDLVPEGFDQTFDLAVCNFSLIGKESVERVFNAVPKLLNKDGNFVVQTLHPVTASQDTPYKDGWRQGSWAGFNSDFTDPAPWYFRTIESWIQLFVSSRFSIEAVEAPLDSATDMPASLIITGRLNS